MYKRQGICRAAKWLVNKIGFLKKRFHLLDSIDRFEADFGSYTDDFKQKKKSLLAGILLSIPQFILQMSVIYFIFRAFGYREVNYFEIFAIQSLLQVSVSFMPMPGASGAQEIGFSSYFKNYFVNNDLYAAVMVWRFFTYYLVVIAGALSLIHISSQADGNTCSGVAVNITSQVAARKKVEYERDFDPLTDLHNLSLIHI